MDYLRHRRARFAVSVLVAISLAGCAGAGMSPQSSSLGSNGTAPSFRDKLSVRSTRTRLEVAANSATDARAHAQDYSNPSNETTADPTVTRPAETPCIVPLFSNFQFADFNPKLFNYSASCPGPWAKVVLDADFSINAGRQFDRTGSIWIAGTNVYFGTTAEPSRNFGPSWHVEKDVTDLTPIFQTASQGEVVLDNLVNDMYTSVLTGSAKLEFYPASAQYAAANAPDSVYPLSAGPLGGNQSLGTPSQPLTATYTLPQNVRAAYLDVYLQSQGNDEFWYTCFPNDLAAELANCGNTGFREGDVAIDGQAAGVVPIYPWIYTGGIDPYLWRPIPGVETLNFRPYRVDLTPFAGVLSNGQPHTINVTVFNNGNSFSANGALLVYLDHASTQVTGGIISNGTALQPAPSVMENVTTNAQGVATGTIDVRSTHIVNIDGFVNTSSGRVETDVHQTISFDNNQKIDVSNTVFDQNITQDTKILSETTTHQSGSGQSSNSFGHNGQSTQTETQDWPLSLVYDYVVNSDGSAVQTTTVAQGKTKTLDRHDAGSGSPFHAESSNVVNATDTLTFFADGSYAPSNGKTTQTYRANSSTGYCWNKTVSATTGTVTENSGGPC